MSEYSEQEELAYILSHDLQEPVRMISSYLKLLEKKYEGLLDGDAKEYINYAVDGSNRLKLMIDDLLSYSRVSQHKTKKIRFGLKDTVDSAVSKIREKYRSTKVKFIFEPDQLPEIVADKNQIFQLFLNILDNAAKFNRSAEKEIFVTIEIENNSVIVCVSDNGIGISGEYHEDVFRIFKKLHNHSEYGGSGIGLALCRKIVENHNGSIWLESKKGKGAKFYIKLPQ